MNYIKQSISFFEMQLSNQISSNAQALYYTLLNINNKCNWKERFTVANSMMTAYTGLNTSAIQRARNELIQFGVIEYKKGKGNKCGEYLLCKLYPDFEQQTDSNADNKPITSRQQSALQTDTLYKQNNTKQNNTKQNTLKKESVKEKKKSAYGEYAHVLLTDDEYASLGEKYPNREELIKFLDEYIEMKGTYKAANHYMAILRWVTKAVEERKPSQDFEKGPLNNFKQPDIDYKSVEDILWERQKRLLEEC